MLCKTQRQLIKQIIGARMMPWTETPGAKTDFRLVQSYIPFAEMLTRALVFALLALQLRAFVPAHVFLTVVFLVVYVDVLLHAGKQSSAICMHLIPVAFMLTTSDRQHILTVGHNLHMALDATWACVCVVHYACNMLRVYAAYLWVRVALILLSVLVHMPSTAYDMTPAQVYLRLLLFYTLCFVHYHVFSGRVSFDNHTHTLLGPNVNLYVLFVHPYALLLALAAKCCIFCKLYFEDSRHKRDDYQSKAAPVSTSLASEQELHELMLELRAAQSSKV
jgi:hypothetical protein